MVPAHWSRLHTMQYICSTCGSYTFNRGLLVLARFHNHIYTYNTYHQFTNQYAAFYSLYYYILLQHTYTHASKFAAYIHTTTCSHTHIQRICLLLLQHPLYITIPTYKHKNYLTYTHRIHAHIAIRTNWFTRTREAPKPYPVTKPKP